MLAAFSPLPKDLLIFVLSVAVAALANLLTPTMGSQAVSQRTLADDTKRVTVTVRSGGFRAHP